MSEWFPFLHEWLNLFVRWIHLIAGISWIGSSFYFMWLDAHIAEPEHPREGVEGELWMVHSGGFYQVEKRLIRPGEMPKILHWFKWEATFTWLSGFVLLGIVYYTTGGMYLVDPAVSSLSPGAASAIGLGLLVSAWFIYDLIFQSPLGKTGKAASAVSIFLIIGVAYGLCHLFSGRAAYIHVGAMFGTLMVLNVWVRILPAQQAMIDATKEGRKPDYSLGLAAKRRSVHNTYMTFPVLFIMLSNHYPMTYAHPMNWVVLLLLVGAGAGVRHYMVAKDRRAVWILLPVGAALLALFVMTAPQPTPAVGSGAGPAVPFTSAYAVISSRCFACHSSHPTDDIFKVAPNGVTFDSPERVKALAPRIRERVVVLKTMPLANKTGISQEERDLLGRWIDGGAKLE
ncbi:MAG: urate hydroxylase PuuD [Deltaproteobacteria bacterium]|nr:urate hydroxylase PuuD [Deltaproteobacteria bacterium]